LVIATCCHQIWWDMTKKTKDVLVWSKSHCFMSLMHMRTDHGYQSLTTISPFL